MSDLSLKQLRILTVLQSFQRWTTRAEMEDPTGRKGFSLALGAPTREIRRGSLEYLGYVERRDDTIPFEYQITEAGERALTEYEAEHGEVPLLFAPSTTDLDL